METASAVTFGGVSLAGSESDDYRLATSSKTARITPKALTYSGLAAADSKVYDGTTMAMVTGAAAPAARRIDGQR